jgi:arylsulfatase A-like enzyme/Flp pilus assembly protein TadD
VKLIRGIAALALCVAVACSKDRPPEPTVRNVILITVDTLRPDALSIYGGKTRTPFFEDFAKRATVFDHALTCVPITLPAHTSLLTGLYPPSHGVRNNGTFQAPSSLTLVSEVAKQNGLNTAAVIGGYPLASRFGLNQGFDFYDDHFAKKETAPGVFLYAEKDAAAVRTSGEKWLTSNAGKGPFFVWLHFFDPHHPYLEHGIDSLTPYQQEVAYVDQQLGLFFDFVAKHQLERDTLVILTADHGEAFGEHGEISHSLFVYNTTLKIPLLISVPGNKPARIDDLVRIIDIAPTLCEIMGWKTSAYMNGASLVPLMKGEKATARDSYAETLASALDFGWSPLFAVQDLRFKYIQAPRPEYYRLDADPGETRNQAGTIQNGPYLTRIKNIVEAAGERPERHVLSPEEREQMESIGYLSSGRMKTRSDAPDPKDKVDVARRIAELTANPMSPAEKAKAYAEIISREPGNPLLLLRYAEILLKLQKYPEAEAVFQQVLALEYPETDLYNGLAAVFFYEGKLKDAENMLKQADSLNLADGETYYNLGELAFNRGERDKAFQYYERSMKLGYALAYYRKARLVEITGGYEDALKLLQQSEALNPEDAQANYEKGMVYFRHSQYQPAADEFKKALAKSPAETALLYNLGLTYSKLGNESSAKDYMRRFLAANPPAELKEEIAIARQLLK